MSLTVTPGATVSDGDDVTPALLNALGNPTVTEADGSSGTTTATDILNYFREPDFNKWAITADLTVGDSALGTNRQWITRHWFADAFGSAAVAMAGQDAAEVAADDPGDAQGAGALKITGATGVTKIEIGQFIPQVIAQQLVLGNFTIGFECYNNTGAGVTPTLQLYTADNPDSFDLGDTTAVTFDQSANMTACPDGAWQLTKATIDGTTIGANGVNGLQVVIRLDSTLDSASEEWWFQKAQLVIGAVANTDPPRNFLHATIPAIRFLDNKSGGTDGGASSTGTFANQRAITAALPVGNAEFPGAGLYGEENAGSNGFKLAPGVYWIRVRAPFYATSDCHSKLDIRVDSVSQLQGPNAFANANNQLDATAEGVIYINEVDEEVTIHQEVSVAQASDGLGQAGSQGSFETYTEAFVWRLSDP